MSPQTQCSQPQVRILRIDDITGALELSRLAGWNQTQQDWQRLIEYEPNGCFAATRDGQLLGTVTTTCYGSELAWIGMMLVDPQFRRRGIGMALLRRSLSYLQDCQLGCTKLDATPSGRPLYEQFGFRAEWGFRRWQRDSRAASGDASIPWQTSRIKLYASLCALDRQAFGCDRAAWLHRLALTSKIHQGPKVFGMLRPGVLASYLGPITAEDGSAALEVVNGLLEGVSGTVFWDVPEPNQEAVHLAVSLGFRPTRELTRMVIGNRRVDPDLRLQYAMAGPSTG